MSITAEYLPSVLKTVAEKESRHKPDNSVYRFIPTFFKRFVDYQILQIQIYLLSSYAINDLSIEPDIKTHTIRGRFQNDTELGNGFPCVIPHFSLISRKFLKAKQECVPLLVLIGSVWSIQAWNRKLLNFFVKEPVLLTNGKEILINPKGIVHPLMVQSH